ncbi:MAG: hypothetical protein WCC59_07905 [Terriglobales bacterium]
MVGISGARRFITPAQATKKIMAGTAQRISEHAVRELAGEGVFVMRPRHSGRLSPECRAGGPRFRVVQFERGKFKVNP